MHFVELKEALNETEMDKLNGLLSYGGGVTENKPDGCCFLSFPGRNLSPWSTKATDIAHNCGLNKIRRIERA